MRCGVWSMFLSRLIEGLLTASSRLVPPKSCSSKIALAQERALRAAGGLGSAKA